MAWLLSSTSRKNCNFIVRCLSLRCHRHRCCCRCHRRYVAHPTRWMKEYLHRQMHADDDNKEKMSCEQSDWRNFYGSPGMRGYIPMRKWLTKDNKKIFICVWLWHAYELTNKQIHMVAISSRTQDWKRHGLNFKRNFAFLSSAFLIVGQTNFWTSVEWEHQQLVICYSKSNSWLNLWQEWHEPYDGILFLSMNSVAHRRYGDLKWHQHCRMATVCRRATQIYMWTHI